MKAVILTGGRGTRLAPYTTIFPKALLPIGNAPILEIILNQLKRHGISEIILACGYLAELIESYLINNKISKEIKITYHREEKPLGTAGALANINGLDDTFLVMNGDILTTINYSKLIQYHHNKKADLTIAITKKKVKINLGVLSLNKTNRVIGYNEKPTKEYPASTGIYIYEPGVLNFIEPDQYLDFPNLVLRLIKAQKAVIGYPTEEFWLDMGNKDDYERAAIEFDKNPNIF